MTVPLSVFGQLLKNLFLHASAFLILAGKITKKREKIKRKGNGDDWIRSTVCQAVGLQESLLDQSAITCCILYNGAIYLYTHYLCSSDKICTTLSMDTD